MDVFSLRDELVGEYSGYATSFLNIRDRRIKDLVETELEAGRLWPEPMIQLNPAFESGGTIDSLCDEGVLHDECRRIFKVGKEPHHGSAGSTMQLHRHQAEAIRIAAAGRNYVLTTGTGSGKSLSYIVPIVDRVLRAGPGTGIKAIIVYPMNALANSQQGELAKFLEHGYPQGAPLVRVRRYTGQESDEERQEIVANPPDVLLTNYVMLELLLTRVFERQLIEAAQGLQFLVLDELHTYRGRQGADVAFLIRRVRQACGADDLQVVGTSATMAGADTFEEQRREVAAVATDLFGTSVAPADVVGESLLRSTAPAEPNDPVYLDAVRDRITSAAPAPADFAGFVADPLVRWVEHAFGLDVDAAGRVVRRVPRPIHGPDGAAGELSALTGVGESECASALRATLMAGFHVLRPGTTFPVFAFRLHQFLSKGDTVYASLEDERSRHVTLDAQKFVPGDRDRVLLPLAFCRECGQEYYSVTRDGDTFLPRSPAQRLVEKGEAGYLYVSSDAMWPVDPLGQFDRLPEDLLDTAGAVTKVKPSMRKWVPRPVKVGTDAVAGTGVAAAYIRAPFRFCLRCGVAHGVRQSDYAKLSTLSSEGRSTATTILTLSALLRLRRDADLASEARKLLSFIDNRQDAALQTGHFNDFVQVGMLRAALWRAASSAGPAGLRHDDLAQRVTDALGLDVADYAADPDVKYMAREDTDAALRGVIGYRLYLDQRRGWRVTQPNLEQCGLLRIDYASLDALCDEDADWAPTHPALADATPATRRFVARVLLDHMRRELAIKVPYLTREELEKVSLGSDQHLSGPWALDDPRPETAYPLRPRSRRKGDERSAVFLSSRAAYGQFLRRDSTFPDFGHKVGLDDSERILRDLLKRLRIAGIVAVVADPSGPDDVPAYMVNAAAMRWVAQDEGSPYYDPLRTPQLGIQPAPPNPYFSRFYRDVAVTAGGIRAAEHTAQVPSDDRIHREDAFRAGRLPLRRDLC